MTDLQTQLVKHIDEAHALEQTVARLLDGLIQTTDDPEVLDRLEHHKVETQRHEATMRRRLEAHGAQPSMVRQVAITDATGGRQIDLRVDSGPMQVRRMIDRILKREAEAARVAA